MPKVELPSTTNAGSGGLVASVPTGLVSATRPSSPSLSPATGMSGVRAQSNGVSSPELAGSDFILLNEPRQRTVGILYARDGAGKTYWAVNYCPEPVVLIGLDRRGEREAKKAMLRGRKVYYLDAATPANVVQMSHEQAQGAGAESLNLITRNYEWAITKSLEWGQGTLVFDTSTELRDIARLAVRGRVDRPMPKKGEASDYGKSDAIINRTLKYFCDRARDSNLNLILLSRAKPVYEGREDTGRITWDTDKIFSQASDWIIGLNMVSGLGMLGGGVQMLGATAGGFGAPTKPTFELQITNPKCAYEETGMVYREQDWGGEAGNPFVFAMQRLLPGSKEGDWR